VFPSLGSGRRGLGFSRSVVLWVTVTVLALAGCGSSGPRASSDTQASAEPGSGPSSATADGGPGVYAGQTADHLNPAFADLPVRVYVPDSLSDDVRVIDAASQREITRFPSPGEPQHIVPSYDLRTLWVLNNRGNTLIPIDAATGRSGTPLRVEDPYNLYFTPDGSSAVVVAEKLQRLDYRDPHTMALTGSLSVPECGGINHLDYAGDGSYALVTCEFSGKVAKVDVVGHRVIGMLDLGGVSAMPQDVRVAPDGVTFYVADMMANGVHIIDGGRFTQTGFVPTGVGAHGLYPSRDGTKLYVANRGSNSTAGQRRGPGSVSVLDFATNQVIATWDVPGGGSPDMGNLTPDGSQLWLSGRYDSEVYVFDTVKGVLLARIPVGQGPHGLTVWPQPGSYSLGHTGNMR
jgi:DNA-binding beta-propeller fold protein YncE/predicted small lipoprotein YifL